MAASHRSPAFPILLAVLAAGALAGLPATASAHVRLVSTTPADGENLDTAPSEVTLTFDGELDPAESGFTVLDHHGDEVGTGEVDLAVADRNVLRGAVTIAEPGLYTVEYSVLGLDGHAIEGSITFGYQDDGEVGGGDGQGDENPDTALPAPRPPAPTLIGLALLALAAVRAARLVLVR